MQGGKVKELRDTVENLTRNYQRLKGQHIPASKGQVIRFVQVVENTGNAYNPHTGAFTAPFGGAYMFLVSVDVNEPYDGLKVMRNGQEVVYGQGGLASADIEWTSDSLPDGATVKACIGETAELQWAFSLQPDDTVVNVEWFTIKEKDDQSVYFTAYVTTGQHIPASAGQVIRFAQVVENTGNAYNPHTGVFTAPYDGGYMFLVSIDVIKEYGGVRVMRNGQEVVWGHADGDSLHVTATVVLSLNAGDTVTVMHWSSNGGVDEGRESVFVGFRVR
nr:hypothetical protein BaRGS_011515 [Batillaria attramentaria]